jgi:hypothetical protein
LHALAQHREDRNVRNRHGAVSIKSPADFAERMVNGRLKFLPRRFCH